MAYTKIKPIKSGTHLSEVLAYIQNPQKTDSKIYIFSKECSAENACGEFETVRNFVTILLITLCSLFRLMIT